MAILWAVYRQDSLGNRFAIGVDGFFTTSLGEKIKVWDLESEAEADAVCKRIYASHRQPHNVDYYPVDYVDGERLAAFALWNINTVQ